MKLSKLTVKNMKVILVKKSKLIVLLLFTLFFSFNIVQCGGDQIPPSSLLVCPEDKPFFKISTYELSLEYYTDNQYYGRITNCLYCNSQSKYANYDQTECINEIPQAKTCSSHFEPFTKNCLICRPSLYLKKDNCVKTYTFPYKFFYKIKANKNADINQKMCLEENEICPCTLPFYYTHSNECVKTCMLESLLSEGYKIFNLPYTFNKNFLLIKLDFSQGIIYRLTKFFNILSPAFPLFSG